MRKKVAGKVISNKNIFLSYSIKIIAQNQEISSQIMSQGDIFVRSCVQLYLVLDISEGFQGVFYKDLHDILTEGLC